MMLKFLARFQLKGKFFGFIINYKLKNQSEKISFFLYLKIRLKHYLLVNISIKTPLIFMGSISELLFQIFYLEFLPRKK